MYFLNIAEKSRIMFENSLTLKILLIVLSFNFLVLDGKRASAKDLIDCNNVRMGQYLCSDPEIDPHTQIPINCKINETEVNCTLARGLMCSNTNQTYFMKKIPCKGTNGTSFETALLLSIFLGTFGVDRFYLGYPALGLVKLCTLGFMFLGQLIDIILIATQIVGPADGSAYVINYYGPGITILRMDNETYKVPRAEWNMQTPN